MENEENVINANNDNKLLKLKKKSNKNLSK